MAAPKRGTLRKMYSLTKEDLKLIKAIKRRALKREIKLTDSLIIRLGILLTSRLSDEELISLAHSIPKPIAGRPSSLE